MNRQIAAAVIPEAFLVTVLDGFLESNGALRRAYKDHSLSRTRIRQLRESACVAVSAGTLSVALAAYRPAREDVRLVHEFLLRHRLGRLRTIAATDTMLTALEILAWRDRVGCLVIVADSEAPVEVLEHHGYTTLGRDSSGAWLQKRLDRSTSLAAQSHHVH